MRIYEIISESQSLETRTGSQIFPVKETVGGGKIIHSTTVNSAGDTVAYSDEYRDSSNNVLVRHGFKNNEHTWYYKNKAQDTSYHAGKISSQQMDADFSAASSEIMMGNYNKKLLANDPNGERTVALAQRMGKNIKESKIMNEDIGSLIQDQLRRSEEIMKWRRDNWGKKITQWPAGTVFLDELQEDTTVNMSPYKDSIKNAETPKQKSAKNKINDLTRK